MLADVIFPAPTAAYLVNLLIPLSAILALGTECAVYLWFQRGIISPMRLYAIVFGVNIFSWVVGLFLSALLPSFLVPKLVGGEGHQVTILATGPHWSLVAMLSFVWACVLSTVLEYCFLWLFRKRLAFRSLGLCVTVANAAGYVVIALTVWVSMHFGFV